MRDEMIRASRILLRLYPYDYRSAFALEILNAVECASQERCARGGRVFVVAEFTGLLVGAATEWFAKLTTPTSVRGRSLPDIRMMRPVRVTREQWF